jgi:hypothetical protein
LHRRAGIIAEEVVEPMPAVLKALCRRMVRWRILPPDREPDTAIVNVYDTGAHAAVPAAKPIKCRCLG